jgi:predicted GIY-YIG superfamily endonuclease
MTLTHYRKTRKGDPRGTTARLQHAGHYIGYTENLGQRLEEHRAGYASKLTGAAIHAGLSFLVARLWVGVSRVEEQRVKNLGGAAKCCPICSPGTTAGTFHHVPRKSRWERTPGKKRRYLRKSRTRSPHACGLDRRSRGEAFYHGETLHLPTHGAGSRRRATRKSGWTTPSLSRPTARAGRSPKAS